MPKDTTHQRPGSPAGSPPRAQIRPEPGPRPAAAYPRPIDAVVLAGTHHNPRHRIQGHNKAFLAIAGRPLLTHVLEALRRSPSIDRVFVVGPLRELEEALGAPPPKVRFVEQAGKMLGNAWAGYQASERLRAAAGEVSDPDRPLLFTSCDLPLITPRAIEDFVARCAAEDLRGPERGFGLLVGIAEEACLQVFYARQGLPGIVRPYVELVSGRYRLANIYVARPQRMAHRDILQAGFSHRKAKDTRNVFALAWTFLMQPGGWAAARIVLGLQAARLASRRPGRIYRALRRRNTREQIESTGSLLLGGALRLVDTPFGGLSIDIDDEEDYRVVGERFLEWSAADEVASGSLPA